MIKKWSKQDLIKDLEHVRDGEGLYKDSRGTISNHELTEPINLIGLIDSRKEQSEQITIIHNKSKNVYSLKVKLLKSFKILLIPNSPKITQVVNAGQTSIIKPNVAHTMVFTKDTTFLNLVRGERDHENYGITHTIKHLFVDKKKKNYF